MDHLLHLIDAVAPLLATLALLAFAIGSAQDVARTTARQRAKRRGAA